MKHLVVAIVWLLSPWRSHVRRGFELGPWFLSDETLCRWAGLRWGDAYRMGYVAGQQDEAYWLQAKREDPFGTIRLSRQESERLLEMMDQPTDPTGQSYLAFMREVAARGRRPAPDSTSTARSET